MFLTFRRSEPQCSDILLNTMNFEAGIVLSLFLIFADFQPRCSYKKERVYLDGFQNIQGGYRDLLGVFYNCAFCCYW